jgi:hypothetical protein
MSKPIVVMLMRTALSCALPFDSFALWHLDAAGGAVHRITRPHRMLLSGSDH